MEVWLHYSLYADSLGTLFICLFVKNEFDWNEGRPVIIGHPFKLDWHTIEHPL